MNNDQQGSGPEMEAEFDDYLNTAKSLGYELLNSASDMQEKQNKRDLLFERIKQRLEQISASRAEAEQRNRELEQTLQSARDEAWREKTALQSENEEEKARAERTIAKLRTEHETYVAQRKAEHERAVSDLRAQLDSERAVSARVSNENESLQRAFEMLTSSVKKFTVGIRDQNDDMGSLLTLVSGRSGGDSAVIDELPGAVPAIAGPDAATKDGIEISLDGEDLTVSDDESGETVDAEFAEEMDRIVRVGGAR